MDNFGIVLGVLFILIYILLTILNARKIPELPNAVILFLSGPAISAGIKVCYLALSVTSPSGEEKSYIFLGGIAVIWVSIQTVIQILLKERSGA